MIGFNLPADLPTVLALDKNGLRVEFAATRGAPDCVTLTMRAASAMPQPLTDFLFQAAVPRVNIIDRYSTDRHGNYLFKYCYN